MTDTVDQAEFDQATRQQPQGPALLALRRRATRQGNQVGLDLARELCGRPWRQRLMIERRLQARSREAAADIANGIPMAAQRLGDGLIRKGFCLVTIEQ